MIKTAFILASLMLIGQALSAQLVARLELKEDIAGICDKNEVYALYGGFDKQVEPVCPVSKDEILKKLNSQVAFV